MSKGKITKVHSFTKYLFQCLLVLIEFGGVSAAFVYITSLIVPCTTVIDCLERGTLGLALYEFLIFVILEAINDGRKDSLIALQSAYCKLFLLVRKMPKYYIQGSTNLLTANSIMVC